MSHSKPVELTDSQLEQVYRCAERREVGGERRR